MTTNLKARIEALRKRMSGSSSNAKSISEQLASGKS